ncbi:hypothetical protein D3C76_1642930 [compost metagenome]
MLPVLSRSVLPGSGESSSISRGAASRAFLASTPVRLLKSSTWTEWGEVPMRGETRRSISLAFLPGGGASV